MAGKRLGYIRVSTIDQNPDRQLEGEQLDKKFIDYASGKTIERPQLALLLDYAREDDIIIVHSMDRLARNVKDLQKIVDDLVERGIKIEFKKENLIFSSDASPMSKFLLHVIGSVAELEHSFIIERLMEGVAKAKREGKYKGRRGRYPILTDEKKQQIKQLLQTRKSKTQIAKEIGISRFTLYKYLPEIEKMELK